MIMRVKVTSNTNKELRYNNSMIYNKIEIVGDAKKRVPYKKGQLYMHEDGEVYILAQVDNNNYGLICLNDGNFWADPKVCMEDVFGCSQRFFELITSPITLTPGSDE